MFRVPKGPFTTRPAALMAVPDRLVYEALAGLVEIAIAERLPSEVMWPRSRGTQPDRVATSVALSWETSYIVKADISSFYEAVDHPLLAVFLISHCSLNVIAARAIEALLTSTMGLPRGLPQGPPGSDVLASAYLLPLDAWLREQGVRFVRYADDYFFGVDSVGAGKDLLLGFEGTMRELGLALNSSKTQVMRRATFAKGLERPSPQVLELRQHLTEERVGVLRSIDDGVTLGEMLETAGVDEETLFDLVYHRTIELDDVLEQFADQLTPTLVETYETYLRKISSALEQGVHGDLSVYERLSREALRVLRLAEAEVEAVDVQRVVTWFPQVAPLASDLIAVGGRRNASWARMALHGHLNSETQVDWVDAWMIRALTVRPDLADDYLVARLRAFAGAEVGGPLTKLESIRALSAAGVLDEQVWQVAFSSLSVPLQSEMVFSALVNADRYPWLVGVGAIQERRISLAVRSLEVGAGRASRSKLAH
ncbi:MAG: RNA-directed DNA polymerase [Microthrixaceae bacterium]